MRTRRFYPSAVIGVLLAPLGVAFAVLLALSLVAQVLRPATLSNPDLLPFIFPAWRFALYAFVYATGFFVVGAIVAAGLHMLVQWDRNAWAAELMRALRRAPERAPADFTLYLRPFSVDGSTHYELQLPTGRFEAPEKRLEAWIHGRSSSVEQMIADALEHDAPCVMLSRTTLGRTPGRIATSDKSWKGDFDLLSTHATWIVCVAFIQPSTLWEIREIYARRLLSKTVFVVPPFRTRFSPIRQIGGDFYDHQDAFRAAAAILRESCSLQMPEVGKDGALITFDESGVPRTRPFPKDSLALHFGLLALLPQKAPEAEKRAGALAARIAALAALALVMIAPAAALAAFEWDQSARERAGLQAIADRIVAEDPQTARIAIVAQRAAFVGTPVAHEWSLTLRDPTIRIERFTHANRMRVQWLEHCQALHQTLVLRAPCGEGALRAAMDVRLGPGVYTQWSAPLPVAESELEQSIRQFNESARRRRTDHAPTDGAIENLLDDLRQPVPPPPSRRSGATVPLSTDAESDPVEPPSDAEGIESNANSGGE